MGTGTRSPWHSRVSTRRRDSRSCKMMASEDERDALRKVANEVTGEAKLLEIVPKPPGDHEAFGSERAIRLQVVSVLRRFPPRIRVASSGHIGYLCPDIDSHRHHQPPARASQLCCVFWVSTQPQPFFVPRQSVPDEFKHGRVDGPADLGTGGGRSVGCACPCAPP